MTEGAAIEIVKHTMCELGVGDYIIRYRHLRLKENEKRIIKAENHSYIFIDPHTNLKIESKAGIYDMMDNKINELQHIHRGIITLQNQSAVLIDARFIQVIPKQNTKTKS